MGEYILLKLIEDFFSEFVLIYTFEITLKKPTAEKEQDKILDI